MLVSVIVCTSKRERGPDLSAAISSLLAQTCSSIEIIIIFDGIDAVGEVTRHQYDSRNNVKIISLAENTGISGARNRGILEASGDIIAFLDDDAVADANWVKEMLLTYQHEGVVAATGDILPVWPGGKSGYLPEELYWLVGLTYEGYPTGHRGEVRNALGANMSFRKEVFHRIGLFNSSLGFTERKNTMMQGEETELSIRLIEAFGRGVDYNPAMRIYHKVSPAKLKLKTLLVRAFYQGYSKAKLLRLHTAAASLSTEKHYLRKVIWHYMPLRLKRLFGIKGFSVQMKQLLLLVGAVIAVGLGFIYGCFQLPTR